MRLLVIDVHKSYAKCVRALGLHHEPIVDSRERIVRGIRHLQKVNNEHERLKNFLNHCLRGVSTKWMDQYILRFHRCVILPPSSNSTSFLVQSLN